MIKYLQLCEKVSQERSEQLYLHIYKFVTSSLKKYWIKSQNLLSCKEIHCTKQPPSIFQIL